MTGERIPLLWVCGPPGVGKTTAGWAIFSHLRAAGVTSGYVDTDQLAILYPEPASDPGRYRIKASNLRAVVGTFRDAGARCMIVSGVLDPSHGLPRDLVPDARVTVCRLRADPGELRSRFVGRAGRTELVDAGQRDAGTWDESDFADLTIDTTSLDVAEVVRRVMEVVARLPMLPARNASPPDPGTAPARGGHVLWLCGATGAGKSTAGFALYRRAPAAGHRAAYVDLDQIGFCEPAPAGDARNHRVKAANLAALWRTYRAAGAGHLLLVGGVEDNAIVETYRAGLGAGRFTVCRLRAGGEDLTARILQRGQGGSWPQPGDPLRGRSRARLLQAAGEAAAEALALERANVGDLHLDTDGRTVDEVVDAVATRTGWPGEG